MQKRSGSRSYQRREIKEIFRTNGSIMAREMRVIDADGEMLGLLSREEALKVADRVRLDLVEISPNSKPPVCKVIDYGKFLFQREKKKKEAKKHQRTASLKEIKMRPKTDVHDYNFKVKHIREFLANGDKVKVTVRFKGREMAFMDLGYRQINRVVEDLGEDCRVEFQPKLEGRTIFMIVAPGKAYAKVVKIDNKKDDVAGGVEKKPTMAQNTIAANVLKKD